MFVQLEQNQGIEFAKARHQEWLAEAIERQALRRAVRAHRAELAARVRFFRMYHVRRLLFRFAPGLAERFAR
ncbi:MAG: hypothetical protein ACM3XM_01905 [Mycobacterium leprae]